MNGYDKMWVEDEDMNLMVAGSREFADLKKVDEFLDSWNEGRSDDWMLVTGGARGVDKRAMQWCEKNEVECTVLRPRNPERREEYLYRNAEMIGMADAVIAFWDGVSRGTSFVIRYAKDREKLLDVINGQGVNQKRLGDINV